jgi:PKD repeat protein
MNIKKQIQLALLFLSFGTVIFLTGCEDEEDPVAAPEASFTAAVDGATVTLTNTSTGEENTYLWDFGDGTTGTSESPQKTYTAAGNYTITLTATNEGGSSTATEEVTLEAGAFDSEGPVITLNGDAAVTVEIGGTYEDAGATATDNVDGDVTANIEVTGEVNTLQPGEYTIAYNVSDAAGNAATEVTRTVTVTFDAGLVVNGDFQTGDGTGWTGNALDVRTEGGDSYNFANVASAGNPFDVNLSQVIEMQQGATYELSFNAASDGERTMIAGIGLNVGPFTSVTQEVSLTATEQRFTYELTATFGGPDSRILFDMGADVGVVTIDEVSLVLIDEGSGGGDGTGNCTGDLVAATTLPLDFEGCETFLGRASTGDNPNGTFGGGITVDIGENPDKTGINPSDFALRIEKIQGADFFAGVQNEFPTEAFDFTGNVLKAKLYSTKANTTFRFELALSPQTDPPTGNPAPASVVVAEANTWTEVEVEFSGFPSDANIYNMIVIKPDDDGSNQPIAETGTYYVDDLSVGAASDTGGGGEVESFCNTSVTHFGGDANSEVLVSIFNVNGTTMRIEVTSANDDPVDALVLPLGDWSPVPGQPLAPNDDDGDGTWVAEFDFAGGAPETVDLYFLWSKASFEGNWSSHQGTDRATVAFDATCN